MAPREPFVSGIDTRDVNHHDRPTGNFADQINTIVNDAQAGRNRNNLRKRYGAYNSPGAQGSHAHNRHARRITGEKDD